MDFWFNSDKWINKEAEKDLYDKSYGIVLYTRNMLKMTNQMFKWKNLPDTIPQRILERYLQTYGTVAFTQVDGKYYVFFGNPGGVPDVYYEPTEFIVANPGLNFNKSLKIGKDCVWIKNDSQYMGLIPTIKRKAKQMVENDISILDAQFNIRIQSLITADNDNAKKNAELYLDRVKEGKPGVILAKGIQEGINTKPFATAGTTNCISQLIELHQYLKADLLSDFGINANFNMKRERINTSESELNQDALLPTVDDMLEMRKNACEEINAMYGLDISVDKNSTWKLKETIADEVPEETDEAKDEIETPNDEIETPNDEIETPNDEIETPNDENTTEESVTIETFIEKADELIEALEESLDEKEEGEKDAE